MRRVKSSNVRIEAVQPCENAHLGCKVYLREKERSEHIGKCNYIFVNCDACGKRVLFRDLYTHQKYKKCYENNLRQEVIRGLRRTRSEVRDHQKALLMQEAHREMMKNWAFRMRVHEKAGSTPRVPSAMDCISHRGCQSARGTMYSSEDIGRGHDYDDVGSKTERGSNRGMTFLTDLLDREESVQRTGTLLTFVSTRHGSEGGDAEGEHSDDDTAFTMDFLGRQTRFLRSQMFQCQRCLKRYLAGSNNEKACTWHQGPILSVFGGMCQHCGRLDHLPGCVTSSHEP